MTNWRKILSWQFNDYSELKKVLDEKRYTYKDLGYELIIKYRGNLDLDSLTTLPDNIQFNTSGSIDLDFLIFLPDNIQFNNKGYVSFHSLTTLPDNIQFNNKGNINLPSLTTLSANIKFNNGGNIYLDSLISLPDNIQFNNKGDIEFDSLTSLPENIQFNNKRDIYLPSLTSLPNNKYEIFHNKGIVYYDWDDREYKEFNPHERNASLKFSWKLPKEEINVGDRVRVIASEELLKAISVYPDLVGEIGAVEEIPSKEDTVFISENASEYSGSIGVIFQSDSLPWYFPYNKWQDFLEIVES